eukprot:TRINITY_DN100063_c0_g1_i1.p1 TRINITY_DN100063_c0_g1~~TRINITY_DN100063_c0_g1_i1.p1  ORF type:complete len:161 (+),score=21.32 TRINITY_DN100063_c0_g1_i1:26-484(+)
MSRSPAGRSMRSASSPGSSSREERALHALIERQRSKMPEILQELKKSGRKTSHWAWWCFPTEMPGACEPGGETFVTARTAGKLFEEGAAGEEWIEVLDLLGSLFEEKGMNVLPSIDHGRVHYFIKFWRGLADTPDAFQSAIERIAAFDWPPR